MFGRRRKAPPLTGNPMIDRTVARLVADGRDLVIVSDHHKPCPACAKWERQVLSITGSTTGTVKAGNGRTVRIAGTLQDAIDNGFVHDGCRHSIGAFTPGLTVPPKA